MYWLLEDSAFDKMEGFMKVGKGPTVQERIDYRDMKLAESSISGSIGILTASDGIANILIKGVMTDEPDLFALYWGEDNTTYSDIIAAVALAESDPSINETKLFVSSPGGQASSLFLSTMQAISEAKKPITSIVSDMAASGAFGLISQTDNIIAQNEMTKVGSVGVVATVFASSWLVEITSTNAPAKRPDVKTEEGKAQVREFIDQIEDVFIRDIAKGRDVTTGIVKRDFGRGNMMLAPKALENGMIDSISKLSSSSNSASGQNGIDASVKETPQGTNKGTKIMDLPEFKTSHPGVFAEAVEEGIVHERKRVSAHMKMGATYDAMDIAQKAIEDGTEFEQTSIADYISAGKTAADLKNRTDDEKVTGAAGDKANLDDDESTDFSSESDEVLHLVTSAMEQ